MEELQAALKGNTPEPITNKHVCVPNPLTTQNIDKGKFNVQSSEDQISDKKDVTHEKCESPATEIHERDHLLKTHSQNYIDTYGLSEEDSSMLEYLNSRRHSHSTTREFLNHEALLDINEDKTVNETYCSNSSIKDDHMKYVEDEDPIDIHIRKDSFFLLSPIEENSEKAETESGENESIYGSCTSGNKSIETRSPKPISYSWDHIPERSNIHKDSDEQYQTLPRAKIPVAHTNRDIWNSFRFPTEPRELDPEAYHQLHTADSQEELQEFLLLESECMTDGKNNGLASAFTMSDEGPRIFCKEETNDDRGTMSGT